MKKLDIGEFIAKRRKALRINQRELADLCGVSEHALGNLERGVGNPTFDLMCRICDVLGLEIKLTPKMLEG